MNVLFVTSEAFNKTGGGMLSRAYIDTLRKMEGVSVFPFVYPKRYLEEEKAFDGHIVDISYSSARKFINTLFRSHPLIGKEVERDLLSCVDEHSIDIVFLFRAVEAEFLRFLRKNRPKVKVVALYIDIYPDVYKLKKKNLPDFIIHYPMYRRRLLIQKYCSENANATIVFNDREKDSFERCYGKSPNLVLPIISKDLFDESRILDEESEKLELLFIGSFFPPNVQGIRWFVENVMPHVSDKVILKIVGNKMEQLKDDSAFSDQRIDVIGTVDDISGYYYSADVIIAPIFEGTGMKTKTAEALMFGKQMLASEEALCGYEVVEGFLCRTAEDYISRINCFEEHRPPKFDKKLRLIYSTQYSTQAISASLKQLFDALVS